MSRELSTDSCGSPLKIRGHSRNKKSESIKNSEVLQILYLKENENIVIPEMDSF